MTSSIQYGMENSTLPTEVSSLAGSMAGLVSVRMWSMRQPCINKVTLLDELRILSQASPDHHRHYLSALESGDLNDF